MGVSFSIPIDYAMDIVDQIKENGEVERGWLGVTIQEVTTEFAKSLDMDSPKGALISQVLEDSPAEDSGLQAMDVIVEFDGKEIIYSADLPQTVGSIRPGKKVKAKVIRDSKEIKLTIKVGKAPANLEKVLSKDQSKKEIIGIELRTLSASEKADLNLNFGLLVIKVNQSSNAAQAGIQENDVITYLNREKIESVEQFDVLINDAKESKDAVMIGIFRNGNQTFRSLKLTN